MAAAALRKALSRAEATTLRVQGGSMRPWLCPGDRVRVRRLAPGEPRLGQVVAVEREARVVVHRVAELGMRGLRTRGDASTAVDDPVPFDAVIGRIDAVQSWRGLWLWLPGRGVGTFATRAALSLVRALRSVTRRLRPALS